MLTRKDSSKSHRRPLENNTKDQRNDPNPLARKDANHLHRVRTCQDVVMTQGQGRASGSVAQLMSTRASIGELPRWKSDSSNKYQDYSDVKEAPSPFERRKARGPVASFLKTLHTLLQDAEEKEFSHIVSWASHGRAFRVHDSKTFVNLVMPQYFRHQKITSFQRQLSIYGFERLTKRGPDQGSYWHSLFLRGMPHLTEKMQRTTVKGKGVRTPSTPETEPDFQAMPSVCVASMPSTKPTSQVAALPPLANDESKPSPVTAQEAAAARYEGDSSAYLASALLRESLLASMMPSTLGRPSARYPRRGDESSAAISQLVSGETWVRALPPGLGQVVGAPSASLVPPSALSPSASGRLFQGRPPPYSEVDSMDLAFFFGLKEDPPPQYSKTTRQPR